MNSYLININNANSISCKAWCSDEHYVFLTSSVSILSSVYFGSRKYVRYGIFCSLIEKLCRALTNNIGKRYPQIFPIFMTLSGFEIVALMLAGTNECKNLFCSVKKGQFNRDQQRISYIGSKWYLNKDQFYSAAELIHGSEYNQRKCF